MRDKGAKENIKGHEDRGWHMESKNKSRDKKLYGHGIIIQYVKAERVRWIGYPDVISEHRHSKRVLGEIGRPAK